jgi:MscS family membrane protein
MPDFWNQYILDNPVRSYVFIAIAILGGLLFKRIFSRFVGGILHRVVQKMAAGVDKTSFLELVTTPLETFLMILISIVALEKLKFPSQLNFDFYEVSVRTIFHGIAKVILILSFFWLWLRIIDFVALILEWKADATNDMRDNQLIIFFRDFLKVIVVIMGALMILGKVFGFHVENIWTGLGIAGAALALATKESIENLIASFIIFFDRPFTVGDFLKVNNISGTVEKIGLRSTRIRTDMKTFVTVPNKQMVDSIVDNQTLRTQRKAEIRLQVGLSTEKSRINQLIESIEKKLDRPNIENPTVFLNDITGTAFLINVDFFTPPIPLKEFNEIKQEINFEILALLESLGIEIAGASTDIKIFQAAKLASNGD